MRSLRILIADDHALIRRGVRECLETHPGWTICAEAGTGREAVEQAKGLRPDIVVLDIAMPQLNGIDAARQILRESPEAKILMLSMYYSERLMDELLNAQVHGYVVKSDSALDLVLAIEALTNGQLFFSRFGTNKVLPAAVAWWPYSLEPPLVHDRLTFRELGALQLLTEGQSNTDMASALDISVKTVETHRSNLMRKLGLQKLADVVRYAIRNRIVEP